MKLEQQSAAEIGKSIAAGKLSSREVTTYFLDRIEQLDKELNSFVHVDRGQATADAEAVDARIAAGDKTLSPLAGVPIALKDILCTQGIPTTCGSRMLSNYKPPYDAGVVERLRQAGLVMIGKTNLDEFAMGGSTETASSARRRTRLTKHAPLAAAAVARQWHSRQASRRCPLVPTLVAPFDNRRLLRCAGHEADLWPSQPLRLDRFRQ